RMPKQAPAAPRADELRLQCGKIEVDAAPEQDVEVLERNRAHVRAQQRAERREFRTRRIGAANSCEVRVEVDLAGHRRTASARWRRARGAAAGVTAPGQPRAARTSPSISNSFRRADRGAYTSASGSSRPSRTPAASLSRRR